MKDHRNKLAYYQIVYHAIQGGLKYRLMALRACRTIMAIIKICLQINSLLDTNSDFIAIAE